MLPWGNCEIVYGENSNLASLNPIRYRGYYYDTETGLYYLNARYYSPEWRRFISPDDTGYLDPETPNGLNLKDAVDVLLRPAYNILVDDILFKDSDWSWRKYNMNVLIRGVTCGLSDDLKPICRGFFNGSYYRYNLIE